MKTTLVALLTTAMVVLPLAVANADLIVLDGNSNQKTIFNFSCQSSKLCDAYVPVDQTGVAFGTSGNPFNVMSLPIQDIRPGPGNISVIDSGSTTSSGQNSVTIVAGTPTVGSVYTQTINGQAIARVQLSGTWTGTATIEGSVDGGTTWVAQPARVTGTSFTGSTATLNGEFVVDSSGLTNIRVRATAAMTGTLVAVMTFANSAGVVQIVNPVRIFDNASGANATIKPASTPPATTDTAVVTGVADGNNVTQGAKADAKSTATDTTPISAMSVWKQISASIQAAASSLAGNLTVISGASIYNTIAASQTAQVMTGGGGGATGDYLSHCTIIPTTVSPGVVTILDNATTVYAFPGGTSSLSNLVPFTIPVGAKSVSGAWKITTGAGLSVVCEGKFA